VSDSDAQFEAALAKACEACGIRAADRFWVRDLYERPSAAPACCGSGCDPCVDDVVAAVELTRQLLDEKRGENLVRGS
jgi:hypothetical protein